MSLWTHINGVIKVSTPARSNAEAMYLAQTVVNHLPKITGSEENVRYYLNLVHGHNVSSNCDEFDQPSNLYNSEDWDNTFEYQTVVLITMDGDLRDRDLHQVVRETTKALRRLSSRLWVQECVVLVREEHGGSFTFNSPKWICEVETTDWVKRLTWNFPDS